jgi:acyl carrier protein
MLFENVTLDDFDAVMKCKVEGAWNLHHALLESPLDFFISLASVAGVVGNRGQAAYSAANVFLDGFMEYRRSLNLSGISIDLAAVSDAGYLADADAKRRDEVLKNIGGQAITNAEVLALLTAAVTGKFDQPGCGQCITGIDMVDSTDNFWIHDPKFGVLREAVENTLNASQGTQLSLRQALKATSDKETTLQILYEALAAKLSDVLTISPTDIDPSMTVSSLGLDSLVAIEIRNWIAREADANVQILELLSSKSIKHLSEIILGKSKLASPNPQE